jgi:hypothetical protein
VKDKSKVYEVIGRIVADADFRAAFIEEAEKAIREAGYELTEEELAILKEVDLEAAAGEASRAVPVC